MTTRLFRLLICISLLTFTVTAQKSGGYSINWNGVKGPYRFDSYCSPKDGVVWMVGGEGSVALISSDFAHQSFPKLQTLPNPYAEESFYGCWFDAEGNGWVVGGNGGIFQTSNYGLSWMEQQSFTDRDLNAITCVDTKSCWIIGSDVFLRTRDGGKTWSPLKDIKANTIDFINRNEGWIADNTDLYYTRDGGDNWTKQEYTRTRPGESGYFFDHFKFLNRSIGWAAGYGKVAFTADGGKTWRTTVIDDGRFVAVIPTDKTSAMAVNKGDSNYCTQNSGVTWKPCVSDNVAKK